ncbi:MAG: hypothetical protein R3358_07580, partial [Woeseiaceae bacterium]|nr:hypothetical protein [Woeseiaceae bacterium]
MPAEAIFQPFAGMLLLTLLVWLLLYKRRIGYMRANRIHPQKVSTPDTRELLLQGAVSFPAHNFRNLLEL